MAICLGDAFVQYIEKTECIGNSLDKINYNFMELDKICCAFSAANDALAVVEGIVMGDGTGSFTSAVDGYDYWRPGTLINYPVGITGHLTTSNFIQTQTNIIARGGISGGSLSVGGATVIGTTLQVGGSVLVYGATSLRGNASIVGSVDCASLVSAGALRAATIYSTGDVVAFSTSDERLKKQITPIPDALEKVSNLKGVEFEWNTDLQDVHEGKDTGVIAQEVEQIMPTAVTTRDNGYKAVKYEKLIPLLIEAVKELKEQNVALKAEIEALKSK